MDDFSKLINDEKPTLVDFFATWCGPCKVQDPILEDVRAKVGDDANIIQIDGDKEPNRMDQYKVDTYPTFIVFKDGQEYWRDSGEKSLFVFTDMLHRVMYFQFESFQLLEKLYTHTRISLLATEN